MEIICSLISDKIDQSVDFITSTIAAWILFLASRLVFNWVNLPFTKNERARDFFYCLWKEDMSNLNCTSFQKLRFSFARIIDATSLTYRYGIIHKFYKLNVSDSCCSK